MNGLQDFLARLKEEAMKAPAHPGVEPIEYDMCPDPIGDKASSSFTTRCVYCKGSTWVTILTDKALKWRGGAYVQHVWPKMSADDRETLVSGTHSSCFDKMFKEDDNEA